MKQGEEISKVAPHVDVKGRRLLIIRLSAMGDVAMTIPVLSALTHDYPNLKITVLTKNFFAPMFAQFKNVEVFEADVKGRHKGVFGLYTLYQDLRARHIDAVADLHNVLRSKVLKRYFRFGGIPFFQIDKGRADKKGLTASKNKIFTPLKTTHQRYVDVFSALGFPVDLSKAVPLSKEELSENTVELIGSNTKKWLGIAPFAAFEGKMYPLRLMEEVIRKLDDTEKYAIFLFGGGKEEEKKLEALATHFTSCINVSGKLSFPEELALISNLDGMLSMDSGNGHLAAMYGIPVITLWGITHPFAGFYPFGQDADNALLANREKFPLIPTSVYGNKMPKGYETAMQTILPGDVFEKVEAVLNR
ncbi:ADP-heptose:LPS heptosyltransferase [Pricia antarctica]|uniref:ADP-heptose:LPS heptosyltransferase n=1 Tax=Pricia antarctica TaxID=641691 RepID=A0A1G6X2F2_9FLAO|nr:glycosyltransferase family 9 protein [Pricia antarctica]SDD71476.1 ADP-heptose:LPS heptosyltransferase [Pricia antarctica]